MKQIVKLSILFLVCGLLALTLGACGDVTSTATPINTVDPLPTVTPAAGPTPVLGLISPTAALAVVSSTQPAAAAPNTPTNKPIVARAANTPVPVVPVYNNPPSKGDNEGDNKGDNKKDDGGKGKSKK